MTPQLEALFATSLRIREYQAAARTIEALAHLASDPQVKATLRQQVAELDETADGWRRRQEADLIETIPSAVPKTIPVEAPAQSADDPRFGDDETGPRFGGPAYEQFQRSLDEFKKERP